MAKNPLDEAESLFRRRRWAEIIRLLEPLSAVYRETARFSVLLGCAYLHKEDSGGAYSCFRRAQSLDFRDSEAALGLAAVYIRRGETDKAVQLYIDILERRPRDRKARRGLDFLRRSTSSAESLPARKVRGLYPEPPTRWGLAIAPLAAAALIAVGLWSYPAVATGLRSVLPQRPGLADVVLSPEEKAAPVGSGGGFDIVLTEKEALAAFDTAKRLFSDYRDEAALVELNRLLVSNATRQVKAKAEALALYVREPSFLTLPDRFGYAEVSSGPRLFEGVGVAWKGLAANVQASPGGTTFDLLVGYHDRKRLEGIVQVRAPFEAKLVPDRPVEVLARVRAGQDGKAFHLECLAIHEQ
jgi:tetratricopeptide (TPR) repeat protein